MVHPALRVYSKILVIAVLGLLFMGSLVTSHDAGLAVPDWPTTYGENMFLYPPSKWEGNIFFEHVHRLVASGIGVMTVVLALWIAWAEKRRWVQTLAYVSLGAVIIQGILGGLTVRFLLPAVISVSHALLAQTFFVLTITIAFVLSREYVERTESDHVRDKKVLRLSIVFFLVIFLQLALGAVMRHTESGLAIPDFPQMGGKLIPSFDQATVDLINSQLIEIGRKPVTQAQIVIHALHRIWALAVVIVCALLLAAMRRYIATDGGVKQVARVICVIIPLQIALGVYTVLSGRNPWIASVHVITGALLLGMSSVLILRSHFGMRNA